MINGLKASTLLLVCIPLVFLTTLGFLLWRITRKNNAQLPPPPPRTPAKS